MACDRFEDLILDYCEDAASPADRALLAAHLADCNACRAALTRQQELDRTLTAALIPRTLSEGFAPRLSARLAEQDRAPRHPWLPRVLDGIGYVSLAFAGACIVQHIPEAANWIALAALAASAAFALWQTGKALRHN